MPRCYFCGQQVGIWERYDHAKKCPNPPKSFSSWLLTISKGHLKNFVSNSVNGAREFTAFVKWAVKGLGQIPTYIGRMKKEDKLVVFPAVAAFGTMFLWVVLKPLQLPDITKMLIFLVVYVLVIATFLVGMLYSEYLRTQRR